MNLIKPAAMSRAHLVEPSFADSSLASSVPAPAGNSNYARAVDQYYTGLYRFGYKLSRNTNDAADLAQETFHILYAKGTDIRELDKMKGWLYTTLYRLFLRRRRHDLRFPAITLDSREWDLPAIGHKHGRGLDSSLALSSLRQLNDVYSVPLTMYYLKEMSYKEVASALGVPIGTVMSRLSRGKNILRQMLQTPLSAAPGSRWREPSTIAAFVPEPAEAA